MICRSMLMILVLCAGHGSGSFARSADQAPPVPAEEAWQAAVVERVKAVVTQAESLGMPTLTNATLFQGRLTPPSTGDRDADLIAEDEATCEGIHVHALLPDGTWLLELAKSYPARRLQAVEIKQLTPIDRISELRLGDGKGGHNRSPVVLLRGVHLGVPDATALMCQTAMPPGRFIGYQTTVAYPRGFIETLTDDRETRIVDWAKVWCAEWFLDQLHNHPVETRWRAAALAMIMPSGRKALEQRFERADHGQVPTNDPKDPASRVARWNWLQWYQVEIDLLPDLSDERLIALVDDLRPAVPDFPTTTILPTVGDHALIILSERWGIDPMVCAGRDPHQLWDDDERVAMAKGLQTWWTSTTGLTMVERWATALARCHPQELDAHLATRDAKRSDRAWTVADRIRNHTYQGERPVNFPDDREALNLAVGAALARRFREALPESFLDWFQVLERCARSPALDEVLAHCPRTRIDSKLLAEWDDGHGRMTEVDGVVNAWLDAPWQPAAVDEAYRDHSLRLDAGRQTKIAVDPVPVDPREGVLDVNMWIRHPTPERWTRLQQLVASGLDAPATRRTLLRCGQIFHSRFSVTTSRSASGGMPSWRDLSRPLAYLALDDQRPLPSAFTERLAVTLAVPLATDLRVRDLVADRMVRSGTRFFGTERDVAKLSGAGSRQTLITALQGPLLLTQPIAERNARIAIMTASLAPLARQSLEALGWPLSERFAAIPTVPQDVGLSADEATECGKILSEAQALGFPDLTGAMVHGGDLNTKAGGRWRWPHLRLANGDWLAHLTDSLEDGQIKTKAGIIAFTDDGPGEQANEAAFRLPTMSAQRLRLNDFTWPGSWIDAGLPAIAFWRSSNDPHGKALVATVLHVAADESDLGCYLQESGRGQARSAGEVVVPTIPDGVRRIVSRWFQQRMVPLRDTADSDRLAATALAILSPADRLVFARQIEGLRQQSRLPERPDPHADLDQRLMAWAGQTWDAPHRKWTSEQAVPATRAETPALVALIGDVRPTRWINDGWVVRTVGDNALRALREIWGFDWRWIVVDQPQVAAVLGRSPNPGHDQDGGDGGQLSRGRWRDDQREMFAQALQAWWQDHAQDPEAPTIAAFDHMPLAAWSVMLWPATIDRVQMTDRVGDAIARQMTRHPCRQDPFRNAIGSIALRLPAHEGITKALGTWQQGPWLTAIATMREELAGRSEAFDAWMTRTIAGDNGEPRRDLYDDSYGPWSNLGFWAYRPTPQRLQALTTLLAGDLESSATQFLLAQVGQRFYPILGTWTESERLPVDRQNVKAIPAALTVIGLADHRPLSAQAVLRLKKFCDWYTNEGFNLAPCDKPRVCDWVALVAISEHRDFGMPQPPCSAGQFVKMLPIERDAVISELRENLTPISHDLLQDAKLEKRGPAIAPTVNF